MALAGPVVIVGGGIGGMSLAAALHVVGVPADVYEQAPEIREVGAGVGLWPNALSSLDQIGAGDAVRASCQPLRRAEALNARGEVLQAFEITALSSPLPDAGLRVVHRAALLAAIHARVPPERVHVGRRCVEAVDLGASGRARFEDGSVAEGALVVGADGLRSVVRRAVLGDDALRYSGQTCFRGVVPFRADDPDLICEIQGPGQRCAICPISEELVYWWTANNAPEGAIVPPGQRRARLLERYRGWPRRFEALLEATPEEAILQNDLHDRAPARGGDPRAAVARYEAARVARTSMIVRRSWIFGQLCRWGGAPLVRLRELIARRTPERWLRAEVERQILETVGPLVTR